MGIGSGRLIDFTGGLDAAWPPWTNSAFMRVYIPRGPIRCDTWNLAPIVYYYAGRLTEWGLPHLSHNRLNVDLSYSGQCLEHLFLQSTMTPLWLLKDLYRNTAAADIVSAAIK